MKKIIEIKGNACKDALLIKDKINDLANKLEKYEYSSVFLRELIMVIENRIGNIDDDYDFNCSDKQIILDTVESYLKRYMVYYHENTRVCLPYYDKEHDILCIKKDNNKPLYDNLGAIYKAIGSLRVKMDCSEIVIPYI